MIEGSEKKLHRDRRLAFRLNTLEYCQLMDSAKKMGLDVSSYLRHLIHTRPSKKEKVNR
jgi:hypothetical protein